jgi:N-acetylglucosamine malate deacetylase 1
MDQNLEALLHVDFMVIAAHADDAELGCGGTILKMVHLGRSGLLVDMTQATAATRGTPEQRLAEAAQAAKLLGCPRINLGLADAKLENSEANLILLMDLMRKYRPRMVFTHHPQDWHPDHTVTAQLVEQAWYKAGLKALNTPNGEPSYRPRRLFHFIGSVEVEPIFCVDISDFWEQKLKVIHAYESQFYTQTADQWKGMTAISSPDFMEFIETRNRYYGTRIKRKYAEGFWCREWAEVFDPCALGERFF